jgi:hypothetical protein
VNAQQTLRSLHEGRSKLVAYHTDLHAVIILADNMEADMKMLQQPDLTPAERMAAQARVPASMSLTHTIVQPA